MARFISLDGIDGVGKSTQADLLCQWLAERGEKVVFCRDPGSTPLGEDIRKILLDHSDRAIGRRSEMFLYMAARAQLVDEVITPALAAGKTVVSDRFLLANVVYQGHAGELGARDVWEVGRVAIDGCEPDRVLVLDLPLDTAATRLGDELDRMEEQGESFRRRLRQGFLDEAAARPEQVRLIDASGSVDEVQKKIRQNLADLFD